MTFILTPNEVAFTPITTVSVSLITWLKVTMYYLALQQLILRCFHGDYRFPSH